MGKKKSRSNKKQGSKPGNRTPAPKNQVRPTPSKENAKQPSGIGRFLSSGSWQGIAALIAIIAIPITALISIAVVNYQRDQEEAANSASLSPSWTVRYNEPGDWTLIWTLRNDGPGIARNVRVDYAGVNTLCTTIAVPIGSTASAQPDASSDDPIEDSEDRLAFGADCEGGMELTKASTARPSDLPLVHVRELEDEALMPQASLYSAVARELAQGESAWVELSFRSSPEFDNEMLPHVDELEGSSQDAPADLEALLERFSVPRASGTNISLQETDYRAIRLAGS